MDYLTTTDCYNGWANKYRRANIANGIIAILVLCGISTWALLLRTTSSTAKSQFRWFMAAITFSIISRTWDCIVAILIDDCENASPTYLVFAIILLWFRTIAEILLLAAFMTQMVSFLNITGVYKLRSTPRKTVFHYFLCRMLLLVWAFSLACQTAYFAERINDGLDDNSFFNLARISRLVYDLLYLVVIAEVLIWGFMILSSSEDGQPRLRIRRNFFLAIGTLLIVRQVWTIVIDCIINSNNSDAIYGTQRIPVRFARQTFYDLCTILAFASLFANMRRMHPQQGTPDMPLETINRPGAAKLSPPAAEPIPFLPVPAEPHWKRNSYKDRSQDPIYCGPEVTDV